MFATSSLRLAQFAATLLGLTTLGLGAAPPASAATIRPAFFGCGWTPANNSANPGYYYYSNVNIRSGADLSCSVKTSATSVNDNLLLRCGWYNSSDGYDWIYVTDETLGVTGWSRADFVGNYYPDGYIDNC
jgi:hypothetical protein